MSCAGHAQSLVLAGKEGTGTLLAPAGGLIMKETTSPSFPQTLGPAEGVELCQQECAWRHDLVGSVPACPKP